MNYRIRIICTKYVIGKIKKCLVKRDLQGTRARAVKELQKNYLKEDVR